MYKTITLIAVISLFSSCDFLFGVRKLGSGYYFDINQVIFTDKATYGGVGVNVIPSKVIKVENNNDYIVAISRNKKNQDQYWIIDKKQKKEERYYHNDDSLFIGYYIYSNVIGPIDSFTFTKLMTDKHIDLHFSM